MPGMTILYLHLLRCQPTPLPLRLRSAHFLHWEEYVTAGTLCLGEVSLLRNDQSVLYMMVHEVHV